MNKTLNQFKGVGGVFPIAVKPINTIKCPYFTSNELKEAEQFIKANKNADIYSSMCTFKSAGCSKGFNIDNITAHFIDIDSHIYQASVEELKELWNLIYCECKNGVLPMPTYAQISGQGVHLWYYLKGNVESRLWSATQKALEDTINGIVGTLNVFYTADPFKLDHIQQPNHLARVSGTYNTKSQTYAQELGGNGKRYSQEELQKKYELILKNEKTGQTKAIKEYTKEEIEAPNSQTLKEFKAFGVYSLDTLRTARLQDLMTIISIRNAKGIKRGYRDNLLYIACYILLEKSKKNDWVNIIEDIATFNNRFIEPLEEQECEKIIKYCLQSGQRYFTNKKIITMLSITDTEQRALKTIISTKIKNERYYKPIKQANQKQRAQAIKKALELKAQGLSTREIAKQMGTAKSNVHRWQQTGR